MNYLHNLHEKKKTISHKITVNNTYESYCVIEVNFIEKKNKTF